MSVVLVAATYSSFSFFIPNSCRRVKWLIMNRFLALLATSIAAAPAGKTRRKNHQYSLSSSSSPRSRFFQAKTTTTTRRRTTRKGPSPFTLLLLLLLLRLAVGASFPCGDGERRLDCSGRSIGIIIITARSA
jgi:hypothetical protein